MFSLQQRLRYLAKLAQTAPSAGQGAQSAAPTTDATGNQASSSTTTSAPTTTTPAPQFDPITGPWAFLTQTYNAQTVGYLRYLLNLISTAMHYATNGTNNLQKNQNDLGSVDPSAAFSVDGKNLILLAKLFYSTFLHGGKPFVAPAKPPAAQQINAWAHSITQSPALLNLTQLNQTGQLAQQLNTQYQLDGSLKQNIINYLGYIQMVNPVQQQAR